MLRFIDGHNDVLLRLHLAGSGPVGFFHEQETGHLDLERARRGGLAAGFFAVYVLPSAAAAERTAAVELEHARREADAMTKLLRAIETAGAVRIARGLGDVEEALAGGPLAAILHLEGAEPIDAGLEDLPGLYAQGLRSIGLVWSRPNAFGEGVPFGFPSTPDTGPGLTDAGRRLVAACNELGILIDLSHLNERGFWDVADRSEAPLVASHSNAHALSQSSRNLTDAQIDAIGRSGGIVGITFHAGMLAAEAGVDASVPLARVVDHVDYVADRVGIDHVGFGSDFDGASMPAELGDVSGLPRLVDRLRERGYGDRDLAQLAHGNWLRVLRETWRR